MALRMTVEQIRRYLKERIKSTEQAIEEQKELLNLCSFPETKREAEMQIAKLEGELEAYKKVLEFSYMWCKTR